MANMLIIVNNNYFLFKNNVEYAWAKFIQANKMLVSMRKYLSYNKKNKIKTLLTKLLYSKIT